MQEIWKDIEGYEGLYQISNTGKIKSLKRYKNNHNKKQLVKEKIRKQIISKTGYYTCMLYKNGNKKLLKVHRLIAQAFIPNPNNYPIINHINGNKLDNNILNLEWCDYSHNNKEAHRLDLIKNNTKGLKKYTNSLKKRVNQYDLEENYIKTWNCISDIQKELGYTTTNICACCKNIRKTAYGFIWKYEKIYKKGEKNEDNS